MWLGENEGYESCGWGLEVLSCDLSFKKSEVLKVLVSEEIFCYFCYSFGVINDWINWDSERNGGF